MEKMSKSSPVAKNRLTVDTPQKINIPKKNDYTLAAINANFQGKLYKFYNQGSNAYHEF